MSMIQPDYAAFVSVKCKPGDVILRELTPNTVHLLHMMIGLYGEAVEFYDAPNDEDEIKELGDLRFFLRGIENVYGTVVCVISETSVRQNLHECVHALCDLLKKSIIYNKLIPHPQIVDAVSSVKTQIMIRCKDLGITLEQLEQINIKKLNIRYREGYSDNEAQARVDMKEGE